MKKVYIIQFYSKEDIDRDEIAKFLLSNNAIEEWEYCLPYSLIVTSNKSAKNLSLLFRQKYGQIRHLIVQINSENYYGRLPKGFWDIFH